MLNIVPANVGICEVLRDISAMTDFLNRVLRNMDDSSLYGGSNISMDLDNIN